MNIHTSINMPRRNSNGTAIACDLNTFQYSILQHSRPTDEISQTTFSLSCFVLFWHDITVLLCIQ